MRSSVSALTVDVEPFYAPTLRRLPHPEADSCQPSRRGLESLEAALAEAGIRATFFFTPRSARFDPACLRRLAAAGHEIAVHGEDHSGRTLPDVSLLREERRAVAEAAQRPPLGYRAPRLGWQPGLAERLRTAGYGYDSSLYPGLLPPRHFGFWRHRSPHVGGGLLEYPLSVWGPLGLPANGFALRLAPAGLLRGMLASSRRPLVLYTHAWEFAVLERAALPAWLVRDCGPSFTRRLLSLISEAGERSWLPLGELEHR